MQREKEELQQRIQDADDAWIETPLPDEVFDNVDFDGNVSYTKEPDKYNKIRRIGGIDFKYIVLWRLTNILPLPPITRRIGNQVKRGTSFVKEKEMTN